SRGLARAGAVGVASAGRPDRARFLAFDVALEPGRVDGLDEEFLGLLDGQAGVPFPGQHDSGAYEDSAGAPTAGIYHPPLCRARRAPGWRARRRLTRPGLAATLARR